MCAAFSRVGHPKKGLLKFWVSFQTLILNAIPQMTSVFEYSQLYLTFQAGKNGTKILMNVQNNVHWFNLIDQHMIQM